MPKSKKNKSKKKPVSLIQLQIASRKCRQKERRAKRKEERNANGSTINCNRSRNCFNNNVVNINLINDSRHSLGSNTNNSLLASSILKSMSGSNVSPSQLSFSKDRCEMPSEELLTDISPEMFSNENPDRLFMTSPNAQEMGNCLIYNDSLVSSFTKGYSLASSILSSKENMSMSPRKDGGTDIQTRPSSRLYCSPVYEKSKMEVDSFDSLNESSKENIYISSREEDDTFCQTLFSPILDSGNTNDKLDADYSESSSESSKEIFISPRKDVCTAASSESSLPYYSPGDEKFNLDIHSLVSDSEDTKDSLAPSPLPSLSEEIPIPPESDPSKYLDFLHSLQVEAYERKQEPLSIVMLAVSTKGQTRYHSNKTFHKEEVLGIYAFDRPESFDLPFCYSALYQGFWHFTMLSSQVSDVLFHHHNELDPMFKVLSKNTDPEMQKTYFSAFHDLQKEKEVTSKATQCLVELSNSLSAAKLFKKDSLRCPSSIFTSGRNLQSACQMKDTRRTACFPKSDPCTNNNSGKLLENQLGTKVLELVLCTLVVNASMHTSLEKRKTQSFFIPLDRDGRNRFYKKYRLEERMKCAEDTVGCENFQKEASPFMKQLTVRLIQLMEERHLLESSLHSIFDCCDLVKEYLPEAFAIRPVDFTWHHFDLLGDGITCPWTIALGCPIDIGNITNDAFKNQLQKETRDPKKEKIHMMMALYGRKVSHDTAVRKDKILSNLVSSDIDLLTRLIARLLHVSQGTEIDNLSLFEGNLSLEQILNQKLLSLEKGDTNKASLKRIDEISQNCNVDPPNKIGQLCENLDRMTYTGQSIYNILAILEKGYLESTDENVIRLCLRCAFAPSSSNLSAMYNKMDGCILPSELPALDKRAQNLESLKKVFYPGNGPSPRHQFDTNSSIILFHCLDEIAKNLSKVCREWRRNLSEDTNVTQPSDPKETEKKFEELKKLKVADLKALAKRRGLKQTGKKDDIIERLLYPSNDSKKKTTDHDSLLDQISKDTNVTQPSDPKETEKKFEELKKLKVADLKALAKRRGLKQTGKKDDLIERLLYPSNDSKKKTTDHDALLDQISKSIKRSIRVCKKDRNSWKKNVTEHPNFNNSKDTQKLSAFTTSKLIQYLALFSIIPSELYHYAIINNDKKGPSRTIKILSDKHFPNSEGTTTERLNHTIGAICKELNDEFQIPATKCFVENILCKISKMLVLKDETKNSSQFRKVANDLCENKDQCCRLFVQNWISTSTKKDTHHFDNHLQQYYHLFYMHPTDHILKMRHSCNDAKGKANIVKLDFQYDSVGNLTILVNGKSTKCEDCKMKDFFPFHDRRIEKEREEFKKKLLERGKAMKGIKSCTSEVRSNKRSANRKRKQIEESVYENDKTPPPIKTKKRGKFVKQVTETLLKAAINKTCHSTQRTKIRIPKQR